MFFDLFANSMGRILHFYKMTEKESRDYTAALFESLRWMDGFQFEETTKTLVKELKNQKPLVRDFLAVHSRLSDQYKWGRIPEARRDPVTEADNRAYFESAISASSTYLKSMANVLRRNYKIVLPENSPDEDVWAATQYVKEMFRTGNLSNIARPLIYELLRDVTPVTFLRNGGQRGVEVGSDGSGRLMPHMTKKALSVPEEARTLVESAPVRPGHVEGSALSGPDTLQVRLDPIPLDSISSEELKRIEEKKARGEPLTEEEFNRLIPF